MCRTFEQVINSMSDTEFDKLIDSVKGLRGASKRILSGRAFGGVYGAKRGYV